MADLSKNRLRWDLTPEDIKTKADELVHRTKAVYDGVGKLKKDEVTYENTLQVSLFCRSVEFGSRAWMTMQNTILLRHNN